MSSTVNTVSSSTQGFDGVLARWEPVIGLEVHCQLKTESKLFCACKTSFGALANQNTCPVCLGLPGVLPVLNHQAVDYAIRMALAIGAEIRPKSSFSRKQYFYPDLPKGYQITQYDLPYCENGALVLDSGKKITIQRIHMEEDAGKNIHGDASSYVDLNRAGIPLLEIVSAPDLSSPTEAHEYLRKLRSIVRYLEISDGNMEEGSIRCDCNVSLRKRGTAAFGTRTEIKNVNSFKNVERAITYEIFRQADLLDHGEKIKQVTLLFDAASGKTQVMRSKEDSPDYRYFPEPDLGTVFIDSQRSEHVRSQLPELPEQKRFRFQADYGIAAADAYQLTEEKELALFFESVVQKIDSKVSPKIVANWILSEYLREHNARQWSWPSDLVSVETFSSLLRLLGEEVISGKIAKMVFDQMAEKGGNPETIVHENGWVQISDTSEIEAVARKIIEENPDQVAAYLGGKQKVFGFFVGQVLKVSQGRFNPNLVNECLRKLLHGS